MSQVTEQIKARLSIADVVGGYLKLERAGANFKARCPFHNEKSASFFVSPARETYHCFGCNRGGDIFTFVQEIEGIDFRGALKVLAERAGVELTPVHSREATERDRILRALEDAATHYEENLARTPRVFEYLTGRGLTKETVKHFRIGYAKDEWRALYDALRKKGHTDAIIEKAGLSVKTEKGYYDRFRGRVMFPIADGSGRVIAFTGRILPDNPQADKAAKYVNSPETEVYHKSRALYALGKAKAAIRREGAVILVEGQMDAIMSHQAGVEHAIAVSGTALTDEHLELLRRLTDRIIVAFDADAAGVAASRRGVDMALKLGFEVRAARITGGKDPADLVHENPEAWREAVAHTEHIIDFYLGTALAAGSDERARRMAVSEAVLPYVALLQNSIDQAHFVAAIAQRLGLREDPIWEELKKKRAATAPAASAAPVRTADAGAPTAAPSRKERIARRIAGVVFWQEHGSGAAVDTAALRERVNALADEHLSATLAAGGDASKDLAFEAEVYYEGSADLAGEVSELMRNFEEEHLRERLEREMERLRQAEGSGDADHARRILKECQAISSALNRLKSERNGSG